MATPELVTIRDFTTSPYSQVADNLDTPLNDILARAESAIQSQLNQRLAPTEYVERFRPSSSVIFLRHRPIIDVTSIKRRYSPQYAWEALDLSNMYIEAGAGYVDLYETLYAYEFEVTYSAGYETLPEVLRQAIILQAVLFAYQDLEVYGAGDAKAPGIGYIVTDIERMIKPFMQNGTVYN